MEPSERVSPGGPGMNLRPKPWERVFGHRPVTVEVDQTLFRQLDEQSKSREEPISETILRAIAIERLIELAIADGGRVLIERNGERTQLLVL